MRKSHFSRFLHHTLSYLGAKPDTAYTLSYSDLIGVSRSNQVANLFHLDYRVKPDNDRRGKDVSLKPDNDSICAGRSMVEMLGVLAIIGVLSVGAIAGYSKAMMKYKLNKHAESFNMLLNNALQLEGKLSFTPNEVTYYGDMFKKLNLIPEGFKYVSNFRLKDMFGNEIWIYHHDNLNNNGLHFSAIGYEFMPTSQGAEICRNIAIVAKENAADLYNISVQKHYNDTDKNYDKIGTLYGDAYCIKNENCLRELDLNKIENLCNACNERACYLYVDWK